MQIFVTENCIILISSKSYSFNLTKFCNVALWNINSITVFNLDELNSFNFYVTKNAKEYVNFKKL